MHFGELGIYAVLFLALYFEVFLFITFLERKPAGKTADRPARFPTVSIIVPCFNEEKTLAATMRSLFALDYPREKLSIVIVDDGSTDGTLKVAESFCGHEQVSIISKKNGGKYTALNLAIERCTSELVGCLDADSLAAPDALLEIVKKFEEDQEVMAVMPSIRVYNPKNPLELMQAVEYTFGIFYKKMFDTLSAISVLPGPLSIYRRSSFETTGMFRHAHNTEDMEMAFRMHAHHLKIANAHTAIAYTHVPRTLRALVKQRTRWSQGFLDNSKDYAYMYFNPRYGYLGLLVLPFALAMFVGSLYITGYLLVHGVRSISIRIIDFWFEGIPLHMPTIRFDWYDIDTNALLFVSCIMLFMTLAGVFLGRRFAGEGVSNKALFFYFLLYGFVAPLWLASAAWGSLRSKGAVWR